MKQFLLKTIKEAGTIAEKRSGKFSIKFKGKRDLVTSVDTEIETFIRKKIEKHYPTHSILGEEFDTKEGNSDYLWIIDPIDGTTNYARSLPCYCISIAIAKNKEIIEGAIYVPDLKELYYAKKGKGAYCNGKQIKVASTKKYGGALIELALSMKTPKTQKQAKKIFNKVCGDCYKIRNFGPTAYAHCLVASGKVDVHVINSANIWDIAAGKLLVEEAGGKVTDFTGKKLGFEIPNVIASNTTIHKEIINVLQ